MTAWLSPLPRDLDGRAGVTVFAPRTDLRRIAGIVCERAWRGQGVRVWRWSCGSLAVVNVGARADAQLLTDCIDALLATYTRHGIFGDGLLGDGPQLGDVLVDLHWSRAVHT